MKENPNIDELLNSFIDGELSARQQVEVQRLIAHNAQIAERLGELQKCKMLVSSLPRAEAPAEMLGQIKAALETTILPEQQPILFDRRQGARHLLVRKVLAAAAMIGLVAVLGTVIYTIVGPERVPDKSIVSDGRPRPVAKVEAQPKPSIVTTAEKSIAEAAAVEFNGRLELKTRVLAATDALINRAIEDNGLLEKVTVKRQGDKSVYALSCNRESLGSLLADLNNVWAGLDSATLFVETDQFARQVVVGGINAGQIAEIANQDSVKRSIEVARDFAVLNSMAERMPGKELAAAIRDRNWDLITIPKPRLTSDEKTIKKLSSPAEKEPLVHLTIVVSGGE